MNNKEVIEKYTDKKLGNTTYGNIIYYYVEDFLDIDKLYYIVGETYSSECSINKKGIDFIKEYYGFKELSKIFAEKGGLDSGARTPDEIHEWLEMLEKESSSI